MKKIIVLIILMSLCFSLWGADLSKTGITDEGTIEAVHTTRLYDIMTGDSTYDNVVFVSEDTLKATYGAKIYRGIIQIEEGSFVVRELVNTFNTLSLDSTGIASGSFKITSTGEFTSDKFYVSSQITFMESPITQGRRLAEVEILWNTTSLFFVNLWKDDTNYYDPSDSQLYLCIEVIVYE